MHGSEIPQHHRRTRPTRGLWPACATLVLALAACTTAAPTTSQAGGATSAGDASPSGQNGAGNASPAEPGASTPGSTADGTIQGSLVTSGVYEATWTVFVGNNGISYSGRWGITSDQGSAPGTGPQANIEIGGDGTIAFGFFNGGIDGVTPPELQLESFTGTGATVDVREFPDHPGDLYICGFTLDTDLTGMDGAILHVEGTMAVVGTVPTTIGITITC